MIYDAVIISVINVSKADFEDFSRPDDLQFRNRFEYIPDGSQQSPSDIPYVYGYNGIQNPGRPQEEPSARSIAGPETRLNDGGSGGYGYGYGYGDGVGLGLGNGYNGGRTPYSALVGRGSRDKKSLQGSNRGG